MSGRGRRVLAVAGLIAGLALFLTLTDPRVDDEVDAAVRRTGGVCLELERWTLLGWSTVGQTHTVEDIRRSRVGPVGF